MNNIKNLIAQNRMQEAIQALIDLGGDKGNEAILLMARYTGIKGDCSFIKADACQKIDVKGSSGSIATQSGDVECGDVTGSVTTMSGDIDCGNISGSVTTMSGSIKHKKN